MSALTSVIDNQGDNTLQVAIRNITETSTDLCIATAYFSLDALALVADNLHGCNSIRILFGDEANKTQRAKLLEQLRARSDRDLADQRLIDPTLDNLRKVQELFRQGRIQARCYTAKKFHAKTYLATRASFPPLRGVLGSGNFTRPGLTQNIELNLHLTDDQVSKVQQWFEARWNEAVEDDVTAVIVKEISRQVDLYDPYAIYQRALIAWGDYHQGGIEADKALAIREMLDPHQALGYSRALEILEREHGVMICDGVGLGKSFVALALMEHFCRKKKNVLIVAPKSIMESSWNSYLEQHLFEYREPYGTIQEMSMTDLGFDLEEETDKESLLKKQKRLQKIIERVDVVVVDESHNFRATNAQRYINLRNIVAAVVDRPDQRKKVILLTATPINTKYQDLSAQLALITQEVGTVAGFEQTQIASAARGADRESNEDVQQRSLMELQDQLEREETLSKVLEAVVIQRKRSTCIELAKAVNKTLLFPERETPKAMEYELSESWKHVVHLSHRRFAPVAAHIKAMKAEIAKAEKLGVELKPAKMPSRSDGLKFAAFLPEQYRTAGSLGRRSYQVEAFLAGLVFTNTMKQLESSPAAFQGILQSLGTSLIARLKYVVGESSISDIEQHVGWVNTPINQLEFSEDEEAGLESGEDADLNGEELDEWLEKTIASKKLYRKLADFKPEEFNVEKWRKDILHDLGYLKEIHAATLDARRWEDFKLKVAAKHLRENLQARRRSVVFTQSQRTSFYLEKELAAELPTAQIARIDSNVKQETRADILYAFCPQYNPKPKNQHRERVDILICTDVLSEGVNMQEAECILNYDIHWNPVRLIQRIGRVDRRLDPAKNPVPHKFSIINAIPPDEINDIILLVDTVEDRTTRISKTLGIDQAFFKATDPAGTLKEFNKVVDGEPSDWDKANQRYVSTLANPDPELQAIVRDMPEGAFGVWDKAPVDGVFALFEMTASERTSDADREHFRSVIGMPTLAAATSSTQGATNNTGLEAVQPSFETFTNQPTLGQTAGKTIQPLVTKITLNAPEILELLSGTVKGERSGNPSDSAALAESLKKLKSHVNQSFRAINLSATIQPRLICWMELRSRSNPNA